MNIYKAIENLELTASSCYSQIKALENNLELDWDVNNIDNWESMLDHVGEVNFFLKELIGVMEREE